MDSSESVVTFENRERLLAGILTSMGIIVYLAKMAMITLNGIPARFHGLISGLYAIRTEDENLLLDFVKKRLMQDEQHMKVLASATPVRSKTAGLLAEGGGRHRYNNEGSHTSNNPRYPKSNHCG